MLAVVKTPRIEISLNGEGAEEALGWLSRKFEITVISGTGNGDTVPIEDTDFWREMNKNRIGNLLEGARLKARLTQAQLAEKAGIKQNMVSDYETGKRRLTKKMAKRFAGVLGVKSVRFLP